MEAMESFSTNTFFFSFLCCLLHDDGDDGGGDNDENDRDGGRGKESDGVGLRPLAVGDQTSRIVAVSRYLVLQGSYSGMLGTVLSPLLTTSIGTDLVLFLSAPYFPI